MRLLGYTVGLLLFSLAQYFITGIPGYVVFLCLYLPVAFIAVKRGSK